MAKTIFFSSSTKVFWSRCLPFLTFLCSHFLFTLSLCVYILFFLILFFNLTFFATFPLDLSLYKICFHRFHFIKKRKINNNLFIIMLMLMLFLFSNFLLFFFWYSSKRSFKRILYNRRCTKNFRNLKKKKCRKTFFHTNMFEMSKRPRIFRSKISVQKRKKKIHSRNFENLRDEHTISTTTMWRQRNALKILLSFLGLRSSERVLERISFSLTKKRGK